MTCKYEEDRIKNEGARVVKHFPNYNPMGAIRCHGHQSTFRSDLAKNLMQPFPHPNDGSDKISLRLAHWLRRYSSLKMSTDTQPDDGLTGILVAHLDPSAQVS